jgi:Ca2+/H+ antiporter
MTANEYVTAVALALAADSGAWIMFCISAGEIMKVESWIRFVPLYLRDIFLLPRLIIILACAVCAAASSNDDGSENSLYGVLVVILFVLWVFTAVGSFVRMIKKRDR